MLIDCPPSLGLLTLNALVAGDEVLIPIQCEYYALEGLGQLLNNIDLVRQHLNPGIAVRTILLTMYDGRTKLADQVADEVRNHFGDLVLQAVIPRNVRVSEAPGYGQSVLTYDPGSRGSTSYVEAARQLAERGRRPAADRPGRQRAAAPTARPGRRPAPSQRQPAELDRDTRSGDDQARRSGPRAGGPHPHQRAGPGARPGDRRRPRAGGAPSAPPR